MSHNLKLKLKTLSGFEYKPKPTIKSGSKLVVKDDNGNTLHEGEFKSFTANFMKLLYGNMCGSGTVTATDLNGDSSAIDSYPNVKMNLEGGSTIQKFGIGVGSGSTAVANADNDLTWVSGLTYGDVAIGTPSIDGTTVKLDITREISNISGSTKTLAEAGLIVGAEGGSDENVLIARDLVSVELLTAQKSTWTYSITVDFDSTAGGFVKNFLDSFIIDWSEILADDATPASTQFNQKYRHQCVVYDSKIWVIGGRETGATNDVWSSTDGSTWTEVLADGHTQWDARYAHQCVVHDSKMWIIGGFGASVMNDVHSSSDGSTWTEVLADGHTQWDERQEHQCLVFDSKMWIIGGRDSSGSVNDVQSTTNGSTWTEVLSDGHAQWSERYAHQCVVFDSKMWIIGGYDGANSLNDVYSTTDGSTWAEVLADSHTQWSQRFAHQCVVFDDKMWIVGGYDGDYLNDVHSSADGSTWAEVLADGHAQWDARAYSQSVASDSKIWIIGGSGGSPANDVWNNRKQLESESTDDTLGIIVGTSDASFSSTATALTAKIDDGTGAGELSYGTFPDTANTVEPAIDGSKTTMSLAREFTNNSGASITIKEVGIESVNGLLCRIVPATSIVVADGGSETILIEFETEV